MKIYRRVNISNGELANIPVKVCTTSSDYGSGITQCCADCNGDVGRKNVCKNCQKEWAQKDILKAYKMGVEKHVFTPEETASLKDSEKHITVIGSTNIPNIDPLHVTGSYYLLPDTAKKSYAVLLQGMEKSGKAIVVNFAFSGKRRVGILTPYNADGKGVILMQIYAYSSQVNKMDEDVQFDLEEKDVSVGEKFLNSLKDVDPKTIENDYIPKLEDILNGERVESPKQEHTKIDELAFFA